MNLIIYTPYGNRYTVRLSDGDITHSNGNLLNLGNHDWQFKGFSHVKRNQVIHLGDIQRNPDLLKSIEWKFKNGHPQYTVIDLDHGTYRKWSNTHYHGVSGADIEEGKP